MEIMLDDGGLTFEEFRDHFQDNILTDEELLALFNQIDTNNNGYGKMCYFYG